MLVLRLAIVALWATCLNFSSLGLEPFRLLLCALGLN